MVFIWPFLPPFSPLTRHNGQVFLGIPDLTIVPNPHEHSANPHAHCANHENHYKMEYARYRPLCLFHCAFGNFCSPYQACPNSSQAPQHVCMDCTQQHIHIVCNCQCLKVGTFPSCNLCSKDLQAHTHIPKVQTARFNVTSTHILDINQTLFIKVWGGRLCHFLNHII
jgi:hypothetical protein